MHLDFVNKMIKILKNDSNVSQAIAGIPVLGSVWVRGSPGYTLWFIYLYKVTYFTTTVNFKHQNNWELSPFVHFRASKTTFSWDMFLV